jgi:hypothetical protein
MERAYGSQQVENTKAHHAYLHGRADAVGEWGKYWSRSPETSWAHAFGRMRGFEQVWYGSVTHYDAQAFEHWLSIYQRYPEVGGKDPRTMLEASVHMLVTDVIEVAEDGMSARGSFITPGLITSRFNSDGHPYCMILWERYGSDFVNEDGQWKYLHEHVCPDLFGEHDCTNWAADDYRALTQVEGEPLGAPDKGTGTKLPPLADLGPLHHQYSVLQPPQNTVPWPEPYAKLDNDHTYASFRGLDPRFDA